MTHLALILDGNRRWATTKGLPKMQGHLQGAKNIKPVIKKAIELGVEYTTLYVLSTENQKNRSATELAYLYELFAKLKEYEKEFNDNSIKLNAIGDLQGLPKPVQKTLKQVIDSTKNNSKHTLTLALNYGGRDEITRAVNNAIKQATLVTENSFNHLLDTNTLPDVDLVIRTGGHKRLSNFLPWQATYAELYFTDIFWPDFSPQELEKAYDWYKTQKRNGGK